MCPACWNLAGSLLRTLEMYELSRLLVLSDAVMTLGYWTVLMCPFNNITKDASLILSDPETLPPAVARDAGEFDVFELPESVSDTPEGVIITPLMMGTAVEEAWMPADEKTVEPADSDI